jgi:hypothetical protein
MERKLVLAALVALGIAVLPCQRVDAHVLRDRDQWTNRHPYAGA